MLLNDIGKTPNVTLRKINQHLETNYGFKISENVTDGDLVSIMEQIQGEIVDLKIRGDDSKGSPEISKRLLVLEGLKSLREFVDTNIQSPDRQMVIDGLCEYVLETFTLAGSDSADFDDCIRDAMKHYRSSKYRFPDDIIENQIRQDCMAKLRSGPASTGPGLEEAGPFDNMGKRAGGLGGHAADVPDTKDARHALRALDNKSLSMAEPDEQVPMIRNPNTGRMMPDPMAAQKSARQKGIYTPPARNVRMKEQANLVKNLRHLLETEVSQAEVMMAAKGFAEELQEMVEKIGRLQNEDLPPVTDQMRETYGMDSASAFQTQIYAALQGVMDSLYTAKNQVDDSVTNLATTGQFSAAVDMDKDLDGMSGDDEEVSVDLDNIEGDLNVDVDDEFGSADEEDPLGRSMKAESQELRRKVLEMQKLVQKARKLRESRG
jgi:hypothetical protein